MSRKRGGRRRAGRVLRVTGVRRMGYAVMRIT